MTNPMTRRELRELEKAKAPNDERTPSLIEHQVQDHDLIQDHNNSTASHASRQVDAPELSRRQMREKGLLGTPAQDSGPQHAARPEANPSATPPKPEIKDSAHLPTRPTRPTRRGSRESTTAHVEPTLAAPVDDSAELSSIEAPEEPLFTGTNLLAEPSTQSIILESTTEAISLPLDTGEIFTTGSISIVSDPATGTQTAGFDLDGITEDQDSVFGVVSTVSPISAMDLIDQRSPMGVVPQSVLRRGWWKPWALTVCALVLAIAAILATITILGAIGG